MLTFMAQPHYKGNVIYRQKEKLITYEQFCSKFFIVYTSRMDVVSKSLNYGPHTWFNLIFYPEKILAITLLTGLSGLIVSV